MFYEVSITDGIFVYTHLRSSKNFNPTYFRMTSLSLTTCSITGLKDEINEELVSFD